MPIEARETTHFYTLPTEDVAEDVAVLRVIESAIRADTVRTVGTALKDFMPDQPKGDAIDRGFGDYILTRPGPKEDGYHSYFFAKPKTAAQMAVPFRSTPRAEVIPWPTMMRNLHGGMARRIAFREADVFYDSQINNERTVREFVDKYEKIPGGQYATEIVVEEFQSPTPWPQLEVQTLVTTTVRYFYKGTQLSLDCLHDDVTIPEQLADFELDGDFGNPGAQEQPAGQFFPATRPKKWQPYVLSDDQEFRNGLYYRVRKRVVRLPRLPKAIRL